MPRSFGTTNAARYAVAPAVGLAGDMYFNTVSNLLFVSNGSVWEPQGGGAGNDEVFVGTADPGGAYEMWYDPDDPGEVAVDEIFVGPDDPGAGYEIWYDTDAIPPAPLPGSATPSGPAGGDLTGTYPTPSVVDDSHGHTGATVSGLDTSAFTTGRMAPARLGTGSADGTVFLRGDQTWAIPPGDSLGAQEVHVGTSDPGATYELWYDTDAASASTNFEEVYVGPGDPGSSFELWYDTDAVLTEPVGEVYVGTDDPGAPYELWFDTGAVPSTDFSPSGPAGGDLTGTYPNPTLTAGAVERAAIQDGAVNNQKLDSMTGRSVKGNLSVGLDAVADLSTTQLTTLIDTFTSALKGVAPASGGGTANFLRADGTWAAPPSGGSGALDAVIAGNKVDVTDNLDGTMTVNVDMSEGIAGNQIWAGGSADTDTLTIRANTGTNGALVRLEGGSLEFASITTISLDAGLGAMTLAAFSGVNVNTTATFTTTAATNNLSTPSQTVIGTKTNDDVTAKRHLHYVETINVATATTLAQIQASATPNDVVFSVEAIVTARQTAGAGTVGHGAAFKRFACFRDIGGTTTQIGATVLTETVRDNSGWLCDFDVSTNNVRVRVTGEASKTIMWHGDITYRLLSI